MTQLSSITEQAGGEHHDALLERALAGKLSDGELVQLKAHTAHCAACAALLELGPALSARLSDSAPDRDRDQRLIARALSGTAKPVLPRRARLVVTLAAAALFMGSLATAHYAGVLKLSSAPEPLAPARQAQPAPKLKPAARATALAQPAQGTDPPPATLANGSRPPAASAEVPIESASALFALANQLRRAGQDAPAIATYRKLQQAHARSEQAALSHATLGSLLLQRGDAQGALLEFDRYIEHGGPVLEEALAGRARALGQRGDRSREAQAWRKLLERFPASVHAARAHARLTELR